MYSIFFTYIKDLCSQDWVCFIISLTVSTMKNYLNSQYLQQQQDCH